MGILGVLPIIGPIIEKVLGIVDQTVADKDLREKIKAELQLKLMTMDYSLIEKEIEAKARVVSAEAEGHSWLQRNWRPITMLVFVYIIAHNYIFAPVFGLSSLPIPPDMWRLLEIGIGGYVVGRSAEKIVKTWKRGE
jgi:hypothetical protein